MTTKTIMCPRRLMTSLFPGAFPETDYIREDGTCSFCGSLDPDVFMDVLTLHNVSLGPTDKPYKVYVTLPGGKFHKFYFQHLSAEQMVDFVELYNDNQVKLTSNFRPMPFFMKEVNANG